MQESGTNVSGCLGLHRNSPEQNLATAAVGWQLGSSGGERKNREKKRDEQVLVVSKLVRQINV